jgi:hypothetical protein
LSIGRSSARRHNFGGSSDHHPVLEIMTMDRRKEEAEFLLKRAEQEAIRAIGAGHPDAAAAHFDLSLRYGERAREALTGEGGPATVAEANPLRQT